ncbi:MAG: response regulator [Timaviella obliquedivisa GSE-PSE-MK23-08B]|jgi:signal transduction histidine kinase/DNA-binding response OmpR family regulator|nr:response regulator [Timaviella obliquedivisa GSE-PSE-MK23-08B]
MAKILVVEDERVATWSIQESLEGFGHTLVAQVPSGSEAIRAAGETQPDLVLMDIQSKGRVDGISIAEQIRSLLKIPIIYLTAHANSRTLKRAISSRHPQGTPTTTRYLIKPFNQTDLHTTIEIALLRNQFEKRLAAIEYQLSTQASDRPSPIEFMNPDTEVSTTGSQPWEAAAPAPHSGLDLVNAENSETPETPTPLPPNPRRVTLPEQCLSSAKQGTEQFIRNDTDTLQAISGAATGSMTIFPGIHDLRLVEAHLEQQVQERTAQLQQALDFEALLKRITEKVRDSLDESQILQTAVEELTTELNTTSCDTGLYDLSLATSTIAYESVQVGVPSAQGKVVYMEDEEAIYSRLLSGKAIQFCWIKSTERTLRPRSEGSTTLACPIIGKPSVIGDIWLYRVGKDGFVAAEVRLVQQVANQCAIAIRQARLYTAVQQQVTELESLNQVKDNFLNAVSHELRTPICSIKMASQLLEIRLNGAGLLEPDGEPIKRYLQILQSECDREISLINNMLDLSRLDAQMEPVHRTPIKLQDWIPHLLEPFAAQRQKQQQQLVVDIPVDLSPVVSDLASLGRILSELLTNAFKYTPAHETIKVSAGIESTEVPRLSEPRAQEHKAQFPPHNPRNFQPTPAVFAIRISNSGVKILPSEQTRIFDKFYRIPNADPWKHGGTGLGLALVKRIVTHIGGEIQVLSQQSWTTFTVYLPLS